MDKHIPAELEKYIDELNNQNNQDKKECDFINDDFTEIQDENNFCLVSKPNTDEILYKVFCTSN